MKRKSHSAFLVHSLFIPCSFLFLSCSCLVLCVFCLVHSLFFPCCFLFIPFSFLVHSLFVSCQSLFFPCSATGWKQHPNMSTYPYSIICIYTYIYILYCIVYVYTESPRLDDSSKNIKQHLLWTRQDKKPGHDKLSWRYVSTLSCNPVAQVESVSCLSACSWAPHLHLTERLNLNRNCLWFFGGNLFFYFLSPMLLW